MAGTGEGSYIPFYRIGTVVNNSFSTLAKSGEWQDLERGTYMSFHRIGTVVNNSLAKSGEWQDHERGSYMPFYHIGTVVNNSFLTFSPRTHCNFTN